MEANKHVAGKYDALTGLRWFAALAVVLRHNLPPANSVLYPFFANGYSGVTVFFVLSGFVIAFRYLEQFRRPSRQIFWNYVVARFARIYPSYIVVLILVGLLFGFPDFWVTLSHFLVIQTWSGNSDVAYALNGPGWSVGVEFFLYLIFPILAIWLTRKFKYVWLGFTIAFLVVSIVTFYFSTGDRLILSENDPNSPWRWIYRNPIFRIGDFLQGMMIAVLLANGRIANKSRRFAASCGGLAIVWILVAMSNAGTIGSAVSMDLLYSVPTSLLIYSLVAPADHLVKRILSSSTFVWLGEISFAVYLVHVPLGSKIKQFVKVELFFGNWMTELFFTIVASIIGGAILHYTIERPLQIILRRWLSVGNVRINLFRLRELVAGRVERRK